MEGDGIDKGTRLLAAPQESCPLALRLSAEIRLYPSLS